LVLALFAVIRKVRDRKHEAEKFADAQTRPGS
jgi:hypothetical protein